MSAQASHERQQTNELRLLTERPKTGDRITVEYIASADLAGEPMLVLRARLRTVATGIGVHQQSVTELERSATGRFHGAFELPDSVVYAVFAVEDRAGRRVDHHGEKWELGRSRHGWPSEPHASKYACGSCFPCLAAQNQDSEKVATM